MMVNAGLKSYAGPSPTLGIPLRFMAISSFFNHLVEKERAGCVTLIVFFRCHGLVCIM